MEDQEIRERESGSCLSTTETRNLFTEDDDNDFGDYFTMIRACIYDNIRCNHLPDIAGRADAAFPSERNAHPETAKERDSNASAEKEDDKRSTSCISVPLSKYHLCCYSLAAGIQLDYRHK